MSEDQPQTIHAKLMRIQQGLKCPKGRENTFNTHFFYRSNSDILAAVKPLLSEHGCVILQTDEVVEIASQTYVVAKSAIYCIKDPSRMISVNGYARENPSRKGMDPAQLTGSASSYARKYSLNGLLAIDDTEDPDTQNNQQQQAPQGQPQQAPQQQSPQQQQPDRGDEAWALFHEVKEFMTSEQRNYCADRLNARDWHTVIDYMNQHKQNTQQQGATNGQSQ